MSMVEYHGGALSADVITFSDTARNHILKHLSAQATCRGLRLSVKKTGCSGLSYVVDYVENPRDDDVIIAFSAPYMAWIDARSYPYLKGMHVDYVKQGLNQKFVFNNPNQTGQCGCGESFTVD